MIEIPTLLDKYKPKREFFNNVGNQKYFTYDT